MQKNEYLKKPEVKAFVDWFQMQLSAGSEQKHTYTKPGGRIVEFSNLADALAKYDWPFRFVEPDGRQRSGNSYEENKTALMDLKKNLVAGILEGNEEKVKLWAIAIVGWGGVSSGNGQWFIDNASGLINELQRVGKGLSINDDERSKLPKNLRFNAGMTKIYSLMLDNFIIYDSRVAAALAWFVVVWLRESNEGKNGVPDLLKFPCMPAKEGRNPEIRKLRDPSSGVYKFQRMNSRASLHAQWNLRASWIIEAVINGCEGTPFHQKGDSVRGLEAALFMWGYDLRQNTPWIKAADMEESEPEEIAIPVVDNQCDRRGLNAQTRGYQSKGFTWRYSENRDAILIRRKNESQDVFPVHEIFSILHRLHDEFGGDYIFLRNNVARLGNGTERPGLGMTIMAAHQNANTTHGQAASYLGPVLETLEFFLWNNQQTNIGWVLKKTPPPSIEDLRILLQGYSDEINE